jgi:hypothetical protein
MQDRFGRCPGGLSVGEWNKVESAAGQLRADAGAQILGLLNAGKIRGGVLQSNHAAETNWLSGNITVNRAASFGNTFAKPVELAHTLSHELRHVQQAEGKNFLERFVMQARYGIDKVFTAKVESEADAYACAVGPSSHSHCQ